MKKLGMFMIMGALAWSLQACNNSNQNDEGAIGTGDSLYNNDGMMSDTTGMGMDTMGMRTTDGATGTMGTNGGMTTDTTGTNRPTPTP